MTSCRSRAKRSRSSATARAACASRATSSSRTIAASHSDRRTISTAAKIRAAQVLAVPGEPPSSTMSTPTSSDPASPSSHRHRMVTSATSSDIETSSIRGSAPPATAAPITSVGTAVSSRERSEGSTPTRGRSQRSRELLTPSVDQARIVRHPDQAPTAIWTRSSAESAGCPENCWRSPNSRKTPTPSGSIISTTRMDHAV